MPTQQVQPESSELLQQVADTLYKARKVVVVTGAGISTNSGIPDFRSENGLYSLIQAQFDAAKDCNTNPRDEPPPEPERSGHTVGSPSFKRRKLSHDSGVFGRQESDAVETAERASEDVAGDDKPNKQLDACIKQKSQGCHPPELHPLEDMPPPRSSPPPELSLASDLRRASRFQEMRSSSPLSSPPPVLFDPTDAYIFESSSEDFDHTDESSPPPVSSQLSNASRTTLPNMKGKDLFDASIWADPLRTSVFYTFATSLRQKVKQVQPTSSHRFISLLRDRGKLVRCYTQNIDQIEEKVGLSTALSDGPGSRGRFSRRSTANAAQLSKMVEEVTNSEEGVAQSGSDTQGESQQLQSQESLGDDKSATPSDSQTSTDQAKPNKKERDPPKSGVECVFLHGSLEQLRCFLCGKVCPWDADGRETETLSGQQPQCPYCLGATVAREERGKRSLGVGKLRPDIVLYGEEHPSAHLISPIVTHDLGLNPDLLLILGTSLRVHGLKIMVREFAKAVHTRGGQVVFVNFTKPPESTWGDVIDYWIQWDCDAWVGDLQERVPRLWQGPETHEEKKQRKEEKLEQKRISLERRQEEKEDQRRQRKEEKMQQRRISMERRQEERQDQKRQRQEAKSERRRISLEKKQEEREARELQGVNSQAKNPAAVRDTKHTGAYWTKRIASHLHNITETPMPEEDRLFLMDASLHLGADGTTAKPGTKTKTKKRAEGRKARESAPAVLNDMRSPPQNAVESKSPLLMRQDENDLSERKPEALGRDGLLQPTENASVTHPGTILGAVKHNPRVRKPSTKYGEVVTRPCVATRKRKSNGDPSMADLSDSSLPPLRPEPQSPPRSCNNTVPEPVEPRYSPAGPLSSMSPNMRSGVHIASPACSSPPLASHQWPSPVTSLRWGASPQLPEAYTSNRTTGYLPTVVGSETEKGRRMFPSRIICRADECAPEKENPGSKDGSTMIAALREFGTRLSRRSGLGG